MQFESRAIRARSRRRRTWSLLAGASFAMLWQTYARPDGLGTLAQLGSLLDMPTEQGACHELPPTPNPDGPSGPSTQCVVEGDGAQVVTLRTQDGRVVWLDYTGPWQRGAAGAASWNAMVEVLERAFGEAKGPRANCRLWSRDDGVVRAALQGSSDGEDGVVRLLRIMVSGADSANALGC